MLAPGMPKSSVWGIALTVFVFDFFKGSRWGCWAWRWASNLLYICGGPQHMQNTYSTVSCKEVKSVSVACMLIVFTTLINPGWWTFHIDIGTCVRRAKTYLGQIYNHNKFLVATHYAIKWPDLYCPVLLASTLFYCRDRPSCNLWCNKHNRGETTITGACSVRQAGFQSTWWYEPILMGMGLLVLEWILNLVDFCHFNTLFKCFCSYLCVD